ncbi:hypothetical protein BDZ91DRAFT_738857 [Kalaharituber pfeilii]|nr:hypothetical protein BDZ91DRAFT_738857 [Kalaharituber pfeilii]
MKFIAPALALALASNTLVLAQGSCAACDIAETLKKCTHEWVDNIVICMNPPCNRKFDEDPLATCEGDVGDDSPPVGSNSTAVTTTTATTSGSVSLPTETETGTPTSNITANATASTSSGTPENSDSAATSLNLGSGAVMGLLAGVVALLL